MEPYHPGCLMTSDLRSIFEVFKIGAGPSSSHSMGPQRAAEHFWGGLAPSAARVRATLYGRLAATGKSHLTDRAIETALAGAPVDVVWDTTKTDIPHPNTMLFEALDSEGARIAAWEVYSVGGGNLEDIHGPVGARDSVAYPGASISA